MRSVARHGANPRNLVPDGDAHASADARIAVVEADLGDTDRDDVRDGDASPPTSCSTSPVR